MRKKGLIILATIVLLTTACTKENNNINDQKETIYYEFGSPTTSSSTNYQDVITSSGSNVFVKLEGEQLSICIYRNNTLECFKNNNYEAESIHLQNVFGIDNCQFDNSYTFCSADIFDCGVRANGSVTCSHYESFHNCSLGGSSPNGEEYATCD